VWVYAKAAAGYVENAVATVTQEVVVVVRSPVNGLIPISLSRYGNRNYALLSYKIPDNSVHRSEAQERHLSLRQLPDLNGRKGSPGLLHRFDDPDLLLRLPRFHRNLLK